MTNFLRISIVAFLFFCNINVINAECSYTEKSNLNKIAANVKVDYEIKKQKVKVPAEDSYEPITDEIRSINLNVYNISPEVYVEQIEEENGETKRLNFVESKNGNFTVNYTDVSKIRKFTYKIYASETTACPGEELKTIYITLPKYNEFYDMCENAEDFSLCKEFITVDIKEYEDFSKKLDNYLNKKYKDIEIEPDDDTTWIDNFLEFLNTYKMVFIVSLVAIVSCITIIIVKKKKRQRELGL